MENVSNIHSYDEEVISFYYIDDHISKIDFNGEQGINDILEYIKKPIAADDPNRNIYLARSIIRLMYMLQLSNDVPIQILFLSLHERFHYLCSRLDIPCKIIRGQSKEFTSYRHETYPAEWCAFMSNDEWHLVDLDGILCGTTYHETQGRIVLESEGTTVFEEQEETEGESLLVFDQFWFCTKPSILVNYDFSQDEQWNLLKSAETSEDFISRPFTYLKYHALGLQFLTDCSSKMYSKGGKCTISIKADPSVLRSHCFTYTLSLVEGSGDLSGIEAKDLPLLVRYAPGIDNVTFNIRFPVSGEYVFEVSVKELDCWDYGEQCFDVVIVCEEADKNCRKLPIDAGIVGFGYGHAAKEAGLKNPSNVCPTVDVNPNTNDVSKPTVLTFQIEGDYIDTIEYGSDIIGDNESDAQTESHVDVETGKLTVVANVKMEGDYALFLTARAKESSDKPEPILNYLLTTETTEDDVEHEKFLKKRKRDLLLEEKKEKRLLKQKALTQKIDLIQQELEELRKLVKDDDDIDALGVASGDHVDEVTKVYKEETEEDKENTKTCASTSEHVANVPINNLSNQAMKEKKTSKMCHLM